MMRDIQYNCVLCMILRMAFKMRRINYKSTVTAATTVQPKESAGGGKDDDKYGNIICFWRKDEYCGFEIIQ